MKKTKILAGALVATLAIGAGAGMAACSGEKVVQVSTEMELVRAIEQATGGEKIVLTDDIAIEGQINVDKKLTLDLNGKTISNSQDIWNEDVDDWSLISVGADGDLTITGEGVLDAKANDCYAADVRDGGKLIVKNSTLKGNVSAVYVLAGDLIVDGGKFEIKQLSTYADYRYLLNCYDENYINDVANITVNGGEFYGFNPDDNLAEGLATDFLADGYEATLNSDGYYVVTNV